MRAAKFSRRSLFWLAVMILAASADFSLGTVAKAQDRSQGRSMVVSTGGIVAAENPLAAQAGATILARAATPSMRPWRRTRQSASSSQ